MKSRDEIAAIAFDLYPDKSGVYRIRSKNRLAREAFIKGYEICQAHYEQKLLLIEMGKEHDKKGGFCIEPKNEKG